jgi:hypothetical protein
MMNVFSYGYRLEYDSEISRNESKSFCHRDEPQFWIRCALETGLRTVAADLYVMIDVDCEDPPEIILEFVKLHEEGFDIVYGERVGRPEPFVLKVCVRSTIK